MECSEVTNEMFIKCDWLAFTVECSLEEIVDFLGFSLSEFVIMPRGARGYKSMIKHSTYDFTILYDGAEDMGIHIEITSNGFNGVFEKFMIKHSETCPFGVCFDTPFDMTHLTFFLKSVRDKSKNISRFDIAIDDYTNKYFCVDEINDLLVSNCCISRFRNYQRVNKNSISCNSTLGNTIYFGSRQSDIMLRVYDKALEQGYNGSWVRWEFEIKNDYAAKVIDNIAQSNISNVAFGLLSNYIRFITLDRSERSKCSTLPLWDKFISNADRLRLYTKVSKRTIEDKQEWFDKQVGPTYAQLMHYDGGDFVITNMNKWEYRGGVVVD